MFEKYIKSSRALQKQMQEFQEKAQASLNQSIGSQSPEFKEAVINIIAKAKNGEVDYKATEAEIQKLKDLQDGNST
jgi:seryl-tRNA synthetase